jgi:hypothetical protein
MSTPESSLTHVPWALGNPMPELTLYPSQGFRIRPQYGQIHIRVFSVLFHESSVIYLHLEQMNVQASKVHAVGHSDMQGTTRPDLKALKVVCLDWPGLGNCMESAWASSTADLFHEIKLCPPVGRRELTFFNFIFTLIEQTYNILYILLVEYRSWCPHCFPLGRGPLWGAEPRFELGPAVQQADVLQSEPRRTLI